LLFPPLRPDDLLRELPEDLLLELPDDLLLELDEPRALADDPALLLPPLLLLPPERLLDLVALFFPPRPEERLCELDFEDDFLAEREPPRLLLLEPEDPEDLDELRPRPEPDDFNADLADDAARLMALLPLPPRLPTALAASAPTTPPTTVPIGPTALPTTAPATAPAVSRRIDGIWMSSDPPDLLCDFESDSLAILRSPLVKMLLR
jgi:hypothetical protein